MTPFIETFTGIAFHPLAPVEADIRIADIARALSQQCRFSGHTSEFYSVAEHCVRVSWLLQDREHSSRVQLWGLLHDASEAYLVDLPTPLKNSPAFAPYRAAEKVVQVSICRRFGLVRKQPDEVTEADQTLLATEARDLMPYRPEHWGKLPAPLETRITPWEPREAERKFLQRFVGLKGKQ